MPTKIEKDSVTGRETTGHEWDGLRELNTPLPKWWLYTLYASIVFAIVYSVLYPSVPGITGYFHGVLGYSTRTQVAADVRAMAAQRGVSMDKIKDMPIEQVRENPQLLAVALTAGRITFAENCQACHGAGGEGRPAYPVLADDVWLWGGKLADIQQTITYGIRSGHPDARVSQMPRFGADAILQPAQIQQVADYVMALYGKPVAGADTAAGATVFAENCAACHGDKGQGNREFGAPALASQVHLYGDTRAVVVAQITNPRQGVMPNWNVRLDPATIKSVALYVHSLGGGE
ncbi:MAG: cytochrome-c oxidase, cbb3-type subunit III [Rhodospirillales bacterium 70-18]|nr:cytochrome-c oxidase, cbb3-type subunit III [Rhodospirillales bacterium]OJY65400.1 MAG: cytochrome-c oxidase, cbb3-type subunit III [Rhodospirillales bacterium 70-18]